MQPPPKKNTHTQTQSQLTHKSKNSQTVIPKLKEIHNWLQKQFSKELQNLQDDWQLNLMKKNIINK